MKQLEHELQSAVIKILRLNGYFCFANTNAAQRSVKMGAYMKKEGLLAGVADITILMSGGRVAFIEMKLPDAKSKQSDTQKEFEKNVTKLGFTYRVWRSIEDCINFIMDNEK